MKSLLKTSIQKLLGNDTYQYLQIISSGTDIYIPEFDRTKSIFIHVPKAAGTSVGETLYGNGRTGHYPANLYKRVDPKKFTEYYSFSFVRNPLDRLVSAYVYLKGGGKSEHDKIWADMNLSSYRDFNDFVQNGLHQSNIKNWIHFIPQSKFICDRHGNNIVNFVGKFESLEYDFEHICKNLNVPLTTLPKVNSSDKGDYMEYYSQQSVLKVKEFYRDDFLLFDYNI